MAADLQTIPARAGTATFVPAGSSIKILNSSGTQVIDTWAFALPSPPSQKNSDKLANGKTNSVPAKAQEVKEDVPNSSPAPKRKKGRKGATDLPSQEEAEAATSQGIQAGNEAEGQTAKKSWSNYIPSIPSIPLRTAKSDEQKAQVKANSRTWSQYLGAGQGITSYIPGKSSFTSFAKSHYRDPNKPIIEQITDFSRTPVGAAGMSALSGSGYASSLYAGYSAWSNSGSSAPPAMEYLSMPHTRASTLHIAPKVGDVLVSNLREPMLTVVEDTAASHDTLAAACDPARYRELGVEGWEEHGSCAENLVLALKELNERAGLKGTNGIGADVTVNSAPAALNLFMNVPWTDRGDLTFSSPKGKKGEYIRLKADRDVVVVMSACPQDVTDVNAGKVQDGHFLVEEELEEGEDVRQRLQNISTNAAGKRPVPAKRASLGGVKQSVPAATATKKSTPTPPVAAPPKSSGHTPLGQVKKARTPIGTRKAPPATAGTASSSRARAPPAAPSTTRKDSASTVPSNFKHAGGASSSTTTTTTTSSLSPSSTATRVRGGQPPTSTSNAPPAAAGVPAPTTGPVERKKPRKIQRKVPTTANTTAATAS